MQRERTPDTTPFSVVVEEGAAGTGYWWSLRDRRTRDQVCGGISTTAHLAVKDAYRMGRRLERDGVFNEDTDLFDLDPELNPWE